MIDIVRQDIEGQQANISITILVEDYRPKWEAELAKAQKKAQLKGFRKGKTPLSYVKKLYGEPLLSDIVNEIIQKEIQDYLVREKIHYLGQPIPSEGQELLNLSVDNMKDLTFKFDIGLEPEGEIKGLGQSVTLPYDETTIPAEMVDAELKALRAQAGERVDTDLKIEKGDLVTVSAKEMDKGKEKKNGWQVPITFLVDDIPGEELKTTLLSKKKGDTVEFKITEIEQNDDPAHIRKHLLQLDANDTRDVNEEFAGVIDEVSRLQDAELNQEFFDKAFGKDEVQSEEEAKELIRRTLKRRYDYTADSLLFREIQTKLMEENNMTLPDAFLKRWLMITNQDVTEDAINSEYDMFAKNLQWTIIKNKLNKKYGIEVTPEEIKEGFRNYYSSYFGMQLPDNMLNTFLEKVLQKQDQVEKMYDDLMIDKLFKNLKAEFKLDLKEVSIDDLTSKAQALQHKHEHSHDHDHEHDHNHDHDHHHDHDHDHHH